MRKRSGALRVGIILLVAVVIAGFMPLGGGGIYVHAASKVKLNKTKISAFEGQKVKLKVSGTKKKVKWKSSKKKIAKVSKKGVVTLKKKGKCVIKAKVGKKTLKCRVTVKKRKNTVIYDSDVIRKEVAGEKEYIVMGGSSDTLSVSLPNDDVVQSLDQGDIVMLPSNENNDGIAIKIKNKTNLGAYTQFSGETPEPAEVFRKVEIQEIFTADMSDFEPNTSVVTNARSASAGEKNSLKCSKAAASDARTYTIEKDAVTGTLTIGKPKITPDIDIVRSGLSMKVKNFDVNLDFASNLTVTASRALEIDPIYLGSIPSIKLPYGFVGDIIFYLDVEMDGTFTVESSLRINAGVNYTGVGKPRTYNNSTLKNSLTFEGNLKALLKTNACIAWGGYWSKKDRERKWSVDIAVVGVRGGPGFYLKESYHANQPYQCDDIAFYMFVDLAVTSLKSPSTGKEKENAVKLAFDVLELPTSWTILDNNDKNPIRKLIHYEDGVKVPVCTYDNPIGCFKDISMIGKTYRDVAGKYAVLEQNNTDSYYVYKDRHSSLEFDFIGSVAGPNTGEWGYMLVGDSDICFGMHGSASDILGISSDLSIAKFNKKAGVTLKDGSKMTNAESSLGCLSMSSKSNGMYVMVTLPGVDHKCLLFIQNAKKTGKVTPSTKVFVEGGSAMARAGMDPTIAYGPVMQEYQDFLARVANGDEIDTYDLESEGYQYIYSEVATYAIDWLGESYQPKYAFKDINGDGIQEMFIGSKPEGSGKYAIADIFTLNQSGQPKDLIVCDGYLNERGSLIQYSDGVIESGFEYAGGFPNIYFYKLKSNAVTLTQTDEFLAYSNGTYYHNGTKVSKTTFQNALNKMRNRSVMSLSWKSF